ncbi:MAG: glycogen debranching protein GlgX [Pirellulales bacterium]|nr:glycogen debranching protein GlgX [Pirellulales bacterium]
MSIDVAETLSTSTAPVNDGVGLLSEGSPYEGSPYVVEIGRAHPLGATADADGVNFAVFSEHATRIELLLFDNHDDAIPTAVIELSADRHRTFHFWHCYVRGLKPGTHYAYRVDGPRDLDAGHRFDPTKLLLDPYAKGITKTLWRRGDACRSGSNLATSLRASVTGVEYDWEGDQPLNRPLSETIIYEMHVGGFTRSATSGTEHPGTFLGVAEKIPYLTSLGVTAVELLPAFDFDDAEVLREVDGQPLRNYWGYSTMGYFAPHSGYCTSAHCGQQVREFRDMVKALHKAGIEVILDVVFNHTDEGNDRGPTYSFKGLDNLVYYYLVRENKQYYYDYTGCGNTFNCNHPVPEKLIVDCLEFWVREMHVDGFRFDEGSVLTRGEDGAPLAHPPVIWAAELSETLADTKLFAEAWDAAGLYQIGYFPGYRWGEWNGRYRDDVRRFVRGDAGLAGAVASRIAGSADLYQSRGHLPVNSVNFVDCHDGFTLNDLVSYDGKHNDANGEGNRDGIDDNLSWNCGVEGPAADPAVDALRERQIRNFATILMLSQGVPMFVMGDEVRRTQQGNNNAYCQDNEISWFDWSSVDRHAGMLRFWQRLIAFRRHHSVIHRARFFTGETNARGLADVTWHGVELDAPGWEDPNARALAMTLGGFDGEDDVHVMMNMYWEPLEFALPEVAGRRWHRVIDTVLESPQDAVDPGQEPLVEGPNYRVAGRSVVVLISK